MTVELVQKIQIEFQPAPVTDYENYRNGGGILDLNTYQAGTNFTSISDHWIDRSSLSASYLQARSMASFSEVNLTRREIGIYILLRTLPLQGENVSPKERQVPQKLTDQILLAEVLHLTDPHKGEEFKSKYPNIFS